MSGFTLSGRDVLRVERDIFLRRPLLGSGERLECPFLRMIADSVARINGVLPDTFAIYAVDFGLGAAADAAGLSVWVHFQVPWLRFSSLSLGVRQNGAETAPRVARRLPEARALLSGTTLCTYENADFHGFYKSTGILPLHHC